MKYIRVCDEYENEYITTYQQHCEDVANMQDSGFDFEGCIVKQADTIEKLCDYWDFYDLLDNEYKVKPINLYSVGVMKASLERKTASDIKLAIRTDKGLIYVAKMNDEGELELL